MNNPSVNTLEESVKNQRSRKELHKATRPFTTEVVAKSWFAICSTLAILALLLCIAMLSPWWPVRLAAAVLGGLCMVRGFVIYHDYMHGAILRNSWLAKIIFYTYGAFLLTPPSAWRKSHNYHHAHVGKISESKHGSFPTITTDTWNEMSSIDRLKYRFIRHPLILLCGYLTVFLFSLCIEPLIENLRKHWDSMLVILFHFALTFLIYSSLGLAATIYSYILPLWVASAAGSYFFFVQHNWEGMQYLSDDEWNFYDAAVDSSSYLKLGSVMKWFTGNIGYHHVHHLNSRIPFYRLPEAMAAIPELQNPSTVTLGLKDIVTSLRLKLWDIPSHRMVAFKKS